MNSHLRIGFTHEPDTMVKCKFCNAMYEWNHGYGKCPENCERENEIENAAPIIFTESDMVKYLRNEVEKK